MSLAAIPAYFLARRLLPARLALIAAALTVRVPSMLYTGELMTENAFYPIFLVRRARCSSSRSSGRRVARQVGLLVLCALAFETRAQAVALFAAVATAPLLLGLVERRGWRGDLPAATRGSTGCSAPAALLALAAHRRPRPLAADPARRLPRRRPRAATRRAASSTSSSTTSPGFDLCARRAPVRGAARDVARAAAPDPGGARVHGRLARGLGLADRRGRGVRLGELRRPDRGAEHVLPRAVRADRAPRAGRRRGRAAAAAAWWSRPRSSPACCRSSSRTRASSARARSRTRSPCCRGGGRRTT